MLKTKSLIQQTTNVVNNKIAIIKSKTETEYKWYNMFTKNIYEYKMYIHPGANATQKMLQNIGKK
jgi:c-di-AMP phosphodiesterase-like protein